MIGAEPLQAAGAVLCRPRPGSPPEIALVHRPRYDDWSLPKGKTDPGESTQRTAVREIEEETGYSCVLSHLLAQVTYPVPTETGESVPKRVDYFSARARGGDFTPNDEVDELRWLTTDRAREILTYPSDARVLDAFDRFPTDTVTLLLVRHAEAGSRADWAADDALRPLNEVGRQQTAALRELLGLFEPERVHSAPRVRCEQTVAPVADDLGVAVTPEPLLSEEGYWADPAAGVDRILRLASGRGTALVSSQGGVIPDLLARLGRAAGLALDDVPSRKGSLWTLTFELDARPNEGGCAVPRLVAADYVPDPLRPRTTAYGI